MKEIKYLIMDVDGTLTDGKIYMGNHGECCKAFNVKDGYGIHDLVIPNKITPIIMTGRKSKILENRCNEIGILNFYQGVFDKLEKLKEIINVEKYNEVAYIGDDINDLECMSLIKNAGGVVGCPADAVKSVLNISDFISEKNGGEGAVREFIEWILSENQ